MESNNRNKFISFVDRKFEVSERNSNFKSEIFGGVIVFFSMVYIVFIQASILSEGINIWNASNPSNTFNVPIESIMIITSLTAAIASIFMGLYANYPVALASGMGMNAFVAYSLMPLIGPWGSFLAIFISGVVFLIISFTGIRKKILAEIPDDIKTAIAVGVGFFIVYVALFNSGIIVVGNGVPTELGDFSDPSVVLAVIAIVATVILFLFNFKLATIFGIGATILIGLIFNWSGLEGNFASLPEIDVSSFNYSEGFIGLNEFFLIPFKSFTDSSIWTQPEFYIGIFTLFLTDFFDTSGTLFSINKVIVEEDKSYDNNLNKALKVDAISTTVCSFIGATNVTSFVESSSGVIAGARTGLAPIITGSLFLLTIPVIPFFGGIVTSATTAGALFIVGIFMFRNISKINFKDTSILISTFTIIVFTILTYSIGTGIVFGLLVYIIALLVTGRYKEMNITLYLLIPILILFIILPIFI